MVYISQNFVGYLCLNMIRHKEPCWHPCDLLYFGSGYSSWTVGKEAVVAVGDRNPALPIVT